MPLGRRALKLGAKGVIAARARGGLAGTETMQDCGCPFRMDVISDCARIEFLPSREEISQAGVFDVALSNPCI